jgi:hypothetical protein
MVEVNKNWKNRIARSNSLMSSVCSISDEAFAITVSNSNLYEWIKKPKKSNINSNNQNCNVNNDEESEKQENEGALNEDGEIRLISEQIDIGKISRNDYYKMFYLLQTRKNNNEEDYISWDKGYKDHISVKYAAEIAVKASAATRLRTDNTANQGVVDDYATGNRIKFDEW